MEVCQYLQFCFFRYGRYTVSTLETKIKTYEKEVTQLNKALEKSDRYIEDLQAEVDAARKGKKSDGLPTTEPYRSYKSSAYDISDNPSKRQLFNGEGTDSRDKMSDTKGYSNGESYKYNDYGDEHAYRSMHESSKANSAKHQVKNGSKGKRVTFDVPLNTTTSFDLEMPSLMTSKLSNGSSTADSPMKSALKGSRKATEPGEMNDSFSLTKPSLLDDSLSDDRHKLSRGSSKYAQDDDDLYKRSIKSSDYRKDSDYYMHRSSPTKVVDDSFGLERPGSPWKGKESRSDTDFDETQAIQSELDELDISVTPDFTDCMKLLNRAEKKVTQETLEGNMKPPRDYLADYRTNTDPVSLSSDVKLKEDTKTYSTSTDYVPKTDNAYTTKYYPLDEDFRSGNSVGNKGDYKLPSGDIGSYDKYNKPPSGVASTYKSLGGSGDMRSSVSSTDSARLSLPNASSNYTSDKYSVDSYSKASSDTSSGISNNMNSNTGYKSMYTSDLPLAKSTASYASTSGTAQNRYSFQGRPLGQSAFGRSPSVDNLFISPKSSQNTSGSKFATAEDIMSGYKSTRYSLPSNSSSSSVPNNLPTGKYQSLDSNINRKGRPPLSAVSNVGNVPSQDYGEAVSASLPPRPVRTRSFSDMGTNVSSLSSRGSYYNTRGKTSQHTDPSDASVGVTVVTSSLPPFVDQMDHPYIATTTINPDMDTPRSDINTSVSDVYSSNSLFQNDLHSSKPTNLHHGLHASNTQNSLYTATNSTKPYDILDSNEINTIDNLRRDYSRFYIDSEHMPVETNAASQDNYSYQDSENVPGSRYRNTERMNDNDLDNPPFKFRSRSSSLEIPVSRIMPTVKDAPYALDDSYSSNIKSYRNVDERLDADNRYPHLAAMSAVVQQQAFNASESPYIASSVSIPGASTRSSIDSEFLPSRYSSSSATTTTASSTSYLPSSSHTSVTASTTYTSSNPSTAVTSSYMPAIPPPSYQSSIPMSTYPGPSSSRPMRAPSPSYTAKTSEYNTNGKGSGGGGYSYHSNNSSYGADFSKSDSFLPEPKKRLFESSDDFDMSLSPIKATRKV